MHKNYSLLLMLLVLLMADSEGLLAQNTGKPANAAAAAKNKKLVVKSLLGRATGTIALTADEARQLIMLPLKVRDEKNVDYVLSSYQLAYKRIGITEDEETGKTSPQSDIAAQRFTTTPLPAVWQKNITEGLHAGEELYFFDIIAFDKQGRRFFAPELKITIQ
ncbi:MAG: hypothetical protein JWP81_793 [Ferruginibacter sp.]|nr:hypothetical protein [Ferruginibacter sp.]